MKIPFFLMRAHAKRTWFRTLLTITSVFFAVLIFGALRTFIVGMESTLSEANPSRLVSGSAISLFAHLPKHIEHDLSKMPHVVASDHWTWFGGVFKDESPDHFWGRFGVDPEGFHKVYGSDITLSEDEWKAFKGSRTGCIIGKGLVNKEGFKLGDTIPIQGNIFQGVVELQVLGIYESKVKSFDESTLFFHWDYMNELSKNHGGKCDVVSTFTLLLDSPKYAAEIGSQIDANYESSDSRTRTLTERMFNAQFTSMWGNLPLFFTILGSVVLLACLMVTANTMILNARDRIQEVGIMKSLGFGRASISAMTMIEGILLCLIGGGLAMLCILGLDGSNLMFVRAVVPGSTILEGLGIALFLGVLSGVVPAIMTSRMNIVDSLRIRA
jgi:putative ABC transport system permease protein